MSSSGNFLGIDGSAWLLFVLGVVATACVSYIVYRRQRTPKTLDYAVAELIALSADPSFSSKWYLAVVPNVEAGTILPLNDGVIWRIRVQNTGRMPIDVSDFHRPLAVVVQYGTLIDVAITATSNEDMQALGSVIPVPPEHDWLANLDETKQEVSIPSLLLNAGEWVDIQALTQGTSTPPRMTARVVGESRVIAERPRLLDPPAVTLLWRAVKDGFRNNDQRWAILAMISAVAGLVLSVIASVVSLLEKAG